LARSARPSCRTPSQRVVLVGGRASVDRREARALGQELAPGDAQRQRRIAPLQEPHDGVDGADVALALRRGSARPTPSALRPRFGPSLAPPRRTPSRPSLLAQLVAQPASPREERAEQLDRRIGLRDLEVQARGVLQQETRAGTPSPGTAC
jgi:hypothetical protein